jgi:hypothetical protein
VLLPTRGGRRWLIVAGGAKHGIGGVWVRLTKRSQTTQLGRGVALGERRAIGALSG